MHLIYKNLTKEYARLVHFFEGFLLASSEATPIP